MLINFRVSNFLSIGEMNEFTMIVGNVKKHSNWVIKNSNVDILKFASIYGANSSGKSNFVNALKTSKGIIVNGLEKYDLTDLFNRNQTENISKPMSFEYEIMINDDIFSYGFSIIPESSMIEKEWLYNITKDEIPVFTRKEKIELNFDYLDASSDFRNSLQVYANDISEMKGELFLSFLSKYRSKTQIGKTNIFNQVFEWFRDSLEVISPHEAPSDYVKTYTREVYLKELTEFLKDNDTGITKVYFERTTSGLTELPPEVEKGVKERLKKDLVDDSSDKSDAKGVVLRTVKSIYRIKCVDGELEFSTIRFKHGTSKASYSINEESDGTRRLIELFSVAANTRKNKVFVVDEVDRSLHPLLTLSLISKFQYKDNFNQLIVTTHEDRLLNLNLIRRDQIWFVNKDENNNSQLYSLEEFKERFDKNIMNAYLNGRYGAIPNLDNFFVTINNERGDL